MEVSSRRWHKTTGIVQKPLGSFPDRKLGGEEKQCRGLDDWILTTLPCGFPSCSPLFLCLLLQGLYLYKHK